MNSAIQKNSDEKNLSSVDAKLTFSHEDQKMENVMIHTMKKDLENINNPEYFSNSVDKNERIEPATPTFSPGQPDTKQRTSPFLSQNIRKEDTIRPISPPDNGPVNVNTTPPTPHTPSSWGKLILLACVIFLLFAAAAGGYYFWMNKKSITVVPENIVTPPVQPTLALDKPNYLNIDATGTENINLVSTIDKYVQEVNNEKPSTPVEFLVVDNQNNPIPFKDFALKSNISLPDGVTNLLKDNFSLFIYIDEGKPRIGLAVDSNDLIGADLKKALTESEPDMISAMEPLYLTGPVALNNDLFNTSYYGGAEIRFKNIESPEVLSLDYTIFRDKLIIGTSKMTTRSIIDYLTTNGKVNGVEDVIENIPEEDLQNGNL
jgi:hypothetical protein